MLGPLEYSFGASLRLSACLAVALAAVFAILARRHRNSFAVAFKDWSLATAVISVIVFTQYAPYDGRGRPLDLRPFDTIWHALQGQGDALVAANFALFIPVGIALALHGWRREPIVLAGATLSVAAEVMQYATGNGRVAQIDDVIVNTAGALIGWTVWRLVLGRRASQGSSAGFPRSGPEKAAEKSGWSAG